MRSKALLCLAVSSLSLLAIAQEKYTLKVNVKPEDKFEYMSRMGVSGGGPVGKMIVQFYTAQRVTTIDDKTVKWSGYIAGANVWGGGLIAEAAKGQLSAMRNKGFAFETSLLGESRSDGSTPAASLMSQAAPALQFPENPVSVGDTWERTMDIGGEGAKAICHLQSVSNGVATIAVSIPATDKLKFDPLIYTVDVATGMMISVKVNFEAEEGGQEIKVSMRTERIYPARPRSEIIFPPITNLESRLDKVMARLEQTPLFVIG